MLGSRPGSSHGADLGRGRRSDPGPPMPREMTAPGRLHALRAGSGAVLSLPAGSAVGVGPDPLLQWGRLLLKTRQRGWQASQMVEVWLRSVGTLLTGENQPRG